MRLKLFIAAFKISSLLHLKSVAYGHCRVKGSGDRLGCSCLPKVHVLPLHSTSILRMLHILSATQPIDFVLVEDEKPVPTLDKIYSHNFSPVHL